MTTPDFSRLYAQLNLRPDCSLEEFKRAYRRRVAELHPDRHGDAAPADGEDGLSLPELTSLYGLAMQFRKQHGRLPGGPPLHAAHARMAPEPHARSLRAAPSPDNGFANVSRRSWLLLLVLMAVAAYLVFSGLPAAALGS